MKKVITLLFALVVIATTQAQTNVPIPNGDFSTGAMALSGAGPTWYSDNVTPVGVNTTSFTIAQTGVAVLTPASSGITVGGQLRIVGTTNSTQGTLVVTTPKVDISAYGNTSATFTFGCTIKATATPPTGALNCYVRAYDANGLDVTLTTVVGGAPTKITNALIAGTAVNYGGVVTMQPNSATGGLPATYLTFELQAGKFLTNDLYLDNFTLSSLSSAPLITFTTPVNTALTYEAGNGPSAETTFTVAGTNLTNDIAVSCGSALEISKTSGTGFVDITTGPLTFTQTAGTVAPTTIYLRLKAGLTPGTPGSPNRTVTFASTNATTKTFSLATTNIVTGIAATTTSTALGYVPGAGPSAERIITVQGAALTANVVITPGTNMEISTTTGTGFASTPITLTQTAGVLAATPIYARLIAGLAAATYNDATTLVTASSTGFTNKTVQFVGTVDLGTALANNNIADYKFIPANGLIKVIGVEAGKQIEVFNSVGQKLKSVTASDNNNISLSAKGIYLIKVDTFVQKVILK